MPFLEVNGILRKWPLLFVCVAVGVIGCGGSGSGNGGGSGTGTTTATTGSTTGRSTQGVNIPVATGNVATLDVYFLPGQGRQSLTYTADVQTVSFVDTLGLSTYVENPEEPVVSVGLDSYNPVNTLLTAHVPYPGSGGSTNSRYFTDLDLTFKDLYTSGTGGQTYPGPFARTFLETPASRHFPDDSKRFRFI